MRPTTRRTPIISIRSLALAVGASALTALTFGFAATAANAELSSKKVAYVFDQTEFEACTPECGVNDTSRPESGGSSIFTNAVEGETPSGSEGEYTPAGGEKVRLKNVTLAELDAKPHLLEEEGFDTAILYQTCKIGAPANAAALAQINAFLERAHKVMIFDADACSPISKGEPNWSGFVFPFATNNPGPEGAPGPYTAIEPSSLTTGLALGEQEFDAVGDANIFTTPSLHWFQAVEAENVHQVRGTVMAYSRTPSGGLALYDGEDFWFTDQQSAHLKRVFDNMLNQHWNPDKLPSTIFACTSCGSAVETRLSSALVALGTPITDSATVRGASGPGTATGTMTFTVYSDPHCQLPVAGQAQRVPVLAGGASTAPIALPAGTYYLQAQYSGDANNEGGLSLCGSEVLTVVAPSPPIPTKPPVEKHPPKVGKGGEVEWELEFPEPGEAEAEAEDPNGAEASSVHAHSALTVVGPLAAESATASALDAKRKSKRCKKGFVKKHNKCVNNAPVHYGQGKVAIPTAGVYKLIIKPTGKVRAALKKGKTLHITVKVTFTPAHTTLRLVKTASVKLHLRKQHRGKHAKHKK
jgi:hypothetical protein